MSESDKTFALQTGLEVVKVVAELNKEKIIHKILYLVHITIIALMEKRLD